MKYLINVRIWFDKINGNTYHAISILDLETEENKTIYESLNMVYGEAYQQTTYDELLKLELVKQEERFNHELNRKRFIYSVVESKKKDLIIKW